MVREPLNVFNLLYFGDGCFGAVMVYSHGWRCPGLANNNDNKSILYSWPRGKRPPRERAYLGSIPAFLFSRSSHTSGFEIDNSSGYPARHLAVIGSALELVGPVSVHCDWVR